MENKETLEEAAERLYSDKLYPMYGSIRRDAFINGAKWQQQNSYSEEEVRNIINDYDASQILFNEKYTYNEWFEQFNKNT